MPAKPITGRKSPSPATATAFDKAAAPAAPDTKLSAAFQAALGDGSKRPHLSLPGRTNAKAVGHACKIERPNGKGPAGGPGLSAGFDARRGHK